MPPPGATIRWYQRNPDWYIWNGPELPEVDGAARLKLETSLHHVLEWSRATLGPILSLSHQLDSLDHGTFNPDEILRHTSHVKDAVDQLGPVVERLRQVAHEIQQEQSIRDDPAQDNGDRSRSGSVDTSFALQGSTRAVSSSGIEDRTSRTKAYVDNTRRTEVDHLNVARSPDSVDRHDRPPESVEPDRVAAVARLDALGAVPGESDADSLSL